MVELTHPRYNAKRHTLRYRVRIVPLTTGPLNVKPGREGSIPGRFGAVSLFIDDAGAPPTINGCVLVPYANCPKLRFTLANLAGANLQWITLDHSVGWGSDLTGADLTGATLVGANLVGATFVNATLRYVALLGADLSDADLTGADMYEANLDSAEMTGVDATGANLGLAYMPNTTMTNANLTGVNLQGAYIGFGVMASVDLTDANLNGAVVGTTSLTGATFCRTTMPDGSVNSADC